MEIVPFSIFLCTLYVWSNKCCSNVTSKYKCQVINRSELLWSYLYSVSDSKSSIFTKLLRTGNIIILFVWIFRMITYFPRWSFVFTFKLNGFQHAPSPSSNLYVSTFDEENFLKTILKPFRVISSTRIFEGFTLSSICGRSSSKMRSLPSIIELLQIFKIIFLLNFWAS